LKKIKILLIEDNRLLREGLTIILKKQKDMQVVATFGNGENVSMFMDKHKPDILLLDLGLRNQNSLKIVKLSKQNFIETKIIVMYLIPLESDVFDFVQAGVSGFILKDANVNDLFKTIRDVYKGIKVLPPQLTGTLFTEIINYAINEFTPSVIDKSVRMTKREKQVIELIADGLTNKEIAQKLHLSPYTVKSHVHNILEKLSLSTRVQIAKHAHLSDDYKIAIDTTSLLEE